MSPTHSALTSIASLTILTAALLCEAQPKSIKPQSSGSQSSTQKPAGQKATTSPPAQQVLALSPEVKIYYSSPWTLSAVKYSGATELVVRQKGKPKNAKKGQLVEYPVARILIATENRLSYDDALNRLEAIAASRGEPAQFLEIGGWPAVELRFSEPAQRRGDQEGEERNLPVPEQMLQRLVTAIAADDLVVKFDVSILRTAGPALMNSARNILLSARFAKKGDPADVQKRLKALRAREQKRLSLRSKPSDRQPPTAQPRRDENRPRITAMPTVVHGGTGELEVTASSDAKNIVIASNSGLSFSTDRGVSFATGSPGVFSLNDPSLARGASGNFYLASIANPTATAAQLGVSGCTNAVSRSTDKGANFQLQGYSARCPATGSGLCFPDQEHIAADWRNTWAGWSDFLAEVGALPAGPGQFAVARLPDGRLELWVTDAQGHLFTTWKTTQDPDASWSVWSDFLAEVGALPAAPQQIAVAPLPDGRLELWVTDVQGHLFTTWKTTQDPNSNWSGWSDFLGEVGALPAAPQQIAVAPLRDGRLELWVTDAQGHLFTTWKTTQDPNSNWSAWSDFIAEAGPLPAAARQIAVAPLSDGRLELWVTDAQGHLFTTWKTTQDPNSNWTTWSDFLGEVGSLPASPVQIAVARLSDSRLQLWATDTQGHLFTTSKTTQNPNSNWSGWSDYLDEVGALPATAVRTAAATLRDGRLELWATDTQGHLLTTWKLKGDQLYAVWRNFTTTAPVTTCGGIASGTVTASITCSQDNGANWTATAAIKGAGDFPRVAVGRDGSVYVVTLSGASALVNRFSSCATGLVPAKGFPVTARTLTGAVACAVPGLDRCNNGNTLSSPTVAPDPEKAEHLFVAYAETSTTGGERVAVAESSNRGLTFSTTFSNSRVSNLVSARRYMPWACSMHGAAWVGWYDRRAAATGATNDLTDYFVGSTSGTERNLSGNPDPECASGWPLPPRSTADSESCTIQPQLAGTCRTATGGGSGAGCDFSSGPCPASETCITGLGAPKYGDYNGIACSKDAVIAAWSSATAPRGLPARAGIAVYSTVLLDLNKAKQIAVAPLRDGRLQLWTTDSKDHLFTTWKTTQDPNSNWSGWWDFLAEVGPLPDAPRQAAVAPLSDGRLELWVTDARGHLFTTWKTTQDPNSNWSGWSDFLAEVGALPAVPQQVAVAPLRDGRLELWAIDAQGHLFTTWKTTQNPNSNWSGWSDFLAEVGALPAAPRAIAVAPLRDGRLELWVTDAQGHLFTTWKTTQDPNSNWSGWSDFLAEVGALPAAPRQVAVAPLRDGRLELWVTDAQGHLFTTWKTTQDPNSNWSAWSDFLAEVGALPASPVDIAVGPLRDGRLELWVTDAQGGLFTTWKITQDPNSNWTAWSDFLAEVF